MNKDSSEIDISADARTEPATAGLVACCDLFFSTRILDTARAVGKQLYSVSTAEQIQQQLTATTCDLLLIDLSSAESLLESVDLIKHCQPDLRIIAFGSHVETELLARARQAGCDHVWARSRFTKELAELLTSSAVQSDIKE